MKNSLSILWCHSSRSLFTGLLACFILAISTAASATTYYSAYGQNRTNNITVSIGTHNFQVDGIAANKNTEWYVDGAYTGSAENDWSGTFAIDPEYTKYISGSVQIKALIYDRYWNYEQYHTWNVTLADTTPPTVPSLQTPANGSTTYDQTPYFNWTDSSDSRSGVSHYEIEIYDGDITWGDISATPSSSNYTPSSNIPHDRIYWKVRAVDNAGNKSAYTSEWWFALVEEPDTTPPTNPTSFSGTPAPNAWTTDNSISVSWSGASDNKGLQRYYYQWSASSSYSVSGSDPYTNTSSGSGSKTSSALSDGSSWYFHIRYMDTSNYWASSTAHYGPFMIDTVAPSVPSLQTPANGSTTYDQTPYFNWTDSSDSRSGVSHYEIEIYDGDITWGDISATPSSSNYTPSSNIPHDRIYWKVRAVDNAGNKSAYTSEWWFDLAKATIISAYWWMPLDVSTGDQVTMCAEVANIPVGAQCTFQVYEDDGLLNDNPVGGPVTDDVYQAEGKTYVRATWVAVWEDDQFGDPEHYFEVTFSEVSKKSSKSANKELKVRNNRQMPSKDLGDFSYSDDPQGNGVATREATLTDDRIPIILMHGASGDKKVDSLNYWYAWANGDMRLSGAQLGWFNEPVIRNEFRVYRFVYDSRRPIDENGNDLAQFVNDFYTENSSAFADRQVVIMAHSMGGLVTRYALNTNPSFRSKVHRLITLGTPHLGSPLANPTWVKQSDPSIPLMETYYMQWGGFGGTQGDFDLGWYDPSNIPGSARPEYGLYYLYVIDMQFFHPTLMREGLTDPFCGSLSMLSDTADSQIIAFGGYSNFLFPVVGLGETWPETVAEEVMHIGAVDDHQGLYLARVTMRDMQMSDGSSGFVNNDGFVPLSSALLGSGHTNAEKINLSQIHGEVIDHVSYLDVAHTMGYIQKRLMTMVEVTISPQGAIDAGARWRISGGAWQKSGISLNALKPGQYTIEFKDVAGWTKPQNYSVKVYDNQTTTVSGTPATYTVSQPVLFVSPDNRDVSSNAGTTTFSVLNTGKGTMKWTASVISGGTWLSIPSGSSGTNAGTINSSFTQNTGTTSRTGTIRVTASGATGSPKDVTVTQNGTTLPTLPNISVTVPDGSASETGPDTGYYRISRTGGSTASNLNVYYTMSGSASGSDYSLNKPSPATIPAGASYVDVRLTPVDDSAVEGTETATLTISTNSGYNRVSPYSATINIADNDSLPNQVQLPTFNPDSGSFPGTSVNVTVTCATSGATIRYTKGTGTTPGANPIESSDVVPVNGIVNVPVPGWLKAKAWKTGMNPSGIKSAVYNVVSGNHYRLPDTGQIKCYDNAGNVITCPRPGQPLYGQDAQYKGPQPSYRDNNGNDTVTDLNTGLVWQKEHSSSLYYWQEACNYCDTLDLGGKTDWHLPDKRELASLALYGDYGPSIDRQFFPNCFSLNFMSSSTYAGSLGQVWFVNFNTGEVFPYDDNPVYVRCVRGGPYGNSEFADNCNDTVTDIKTGLVWQQRDDQNDGGGYTWQEALDYCECLSLGGHRDWRLPNVRELQSITDADRYDSSIDPLFDCRSSYYWSSTSAIYPDYKDTARGVDFYSGAVIRNSKVNKGCVRCVRGGPSGALYFPNVVTSIPWQTEIAVINTSPEQTCIGTLMAFSNDGELMETKAITLPSRGRRQIRVADEFTNHTNIGYIIFESDSNYAVGYMKFYVEGRYRVAIPAVSEINTGDIYISHIASDKNWYTLVSLLNTTSLTKTLTIEFDNGQTRTVALTANEHKAFLIRSLFGGKAQPGIHSAVVKNANGVVGLELFTSDAWNQMSGILLNAETTTRIYYPHTASENGWGTGIVAYNPSDTDCNITITPYTAEGYPLSPATDTIYGKQQYIGLVSNLDLPLETAWLKIDSTIPITGFELFARTKLLAGYTGVGITSTKGVFAKLEKDGATGIAFVNIESSAAVVTLTAYNDSGIVVATEKINLDAHQKVVNFAEDIFSGDDISNATYITYSSGSEVVGFQMNASSDGMMLDALPGM